ncbi:MAG: hypothetical protein VX944_02805 [Myxococcota bacterium]|nr:hypothetical protein [Myxococcota bacterium]
MSITRIAPLLLLGLSACSDVEEDDHDHGHHHHDHEVMTTVELTFTDGDGAESVFFWSDADGTANPEIDDIVLSNATEYSLSLRFLNELEDPIEDVTPEIADEDDEHHVFFTGDAVSSRATGENPDALVEHTYDDLDVNGLPIGLENDITTIATGEGDFTVTLRHMPLQNGNTVKTANDPELVATEGFAAIGGANDVSITFSLTVE